ncbi:lipocalin family protein [Acinetobacter sp. GXMZU3951]
MPNFFKKSLSCAAIACLSLFSSWSAQAEESKPQAVSQIEIDQYIGQWYEIAHLPMYFQRHCASNTKANYALNPDQTLSVVNSCQTQTGETISSQGVAYAQNAGKSQLKVSFLPAGLRWIPFTKGDYWVLRVDPNYNVALVGGPSHKYLWILSRSPQIDEATYQSYLQTARQYGYDVTKLVRTPHSNSLIQGH